MRRCDAERGTGDGRQGTNRITINRSMNKQATNVIPIHQWTTKEWRKTMNGTGAGGWQGFADGVQGLLTFARGGNNASNGCLRICMMN